MRDRQTTDFLETVRMSTNVDEAKKPTSSDPGLKELVCKRDKEESVVHRERLDKVQKIKDSSFAETLLQPVPQAYVPCQRAVLGNRWTGGI